MAVVAAVVAAAWTSLAIVHPPAEQPRINSAAEAFIRTPPGFSREGKPAVYSGADSVRLRVTIVDRATGQPTYRRVNVVGANGNFYEPQKNVLAPWSLQLRGARLRPTSKGSS
jgi:hypothetical protein